MPVIAHDELRRIGRRVFVAGGSSEEEAAIIADHWSRPISRAMTATGSG
jgi:hypothetical protein